MNLLESRNRDMDVENKYMDIEREGRVGRIGDWGCDIHAVLYTIHK